MTNIFDDPNIDINTIQKIVASEFVNGPHGANATQEQIDAICDWVSERYIAGQILIMVAKGHLYVNIDPETNEPIFSNTEASLRALEAHEASQAKPSLKIVR